MSVVSGKDAVCRGTGKFSANQSFESGRGTNHKVGPCSSDGGGLSGPHDNVVRVSARCRCLPVAVIPMHPGKHSDGRLSFLYFSHLKI